MAQKPQSSFNGGVISPRLWQQVDLIKYQSGLATCRNVIPIKEGALVRRPGTELIDEVKESLNARLFSFVFSDEDTYIMELSATTDAGDAVFRFYRNGTLMETGGVPYELPVTDYKASELFEIKSLQNYDRFFLFHPNYQTKLLTRFETYWTIDDNAWSGVDNVAPADNYAGVGQFFQSRLLLGGFPDKPTRIWASVAGNEYNFRTSGGTGIGVDEYAFSFDILTTDYNLIRWFQPVKDKVLIGTASSERLMGGASSGAITGTDTNPPEFLMNSAFGSSKVIAEPIGDTIVAAQAPGFKLRNYTYSFEQDKYVGLNLNRLTEHLTRSSTVKQIAYQENPDQVIWVLRNNGILQSLTFDPEEEVFAWAVQEISDGKTTLARVESIEVIPTADDEDEIWLVVRRLINGEEKRYVERFTKQIRANVVVLPSFSPPWGGGFYAPLLVTLIAGSVPGDLYYTFDGSDPSPSNGMLYTVPFYIENPTTIKVADADGNIATGIYTFAGDRLHDFASDPLFDFDSDPLYAVAKKETT